MLDSYIIDPALEKKILGKQSSSQSLPFGHLTSPEHAAFRFNRTRENLSLILINNSAEMFVKWSVCVVSLPNIALDRSGWYGELSWALDALLQKWNARLDTLMASALTDAS